MSELRNFSAFKELIEYYRISDDAQETLKAIKLVTLVAPTSSGRNTIIRELLKTGRYYFIVSDTTRQPRINDGILEKNGVNYWFRSEDEMMNDLKEGKFLEAEILHNQQVSGISIRELEQARQQDKIAITDVDIGGIKHVLKIKPDTVAILVLPPSFEEWQKRIMQRGHMSQDELKRRVKTAKVIFAEALNNDDLVFIINDALSKSVEMMENVIEHGQIDLDEQARARALIHELLKSTHDFLNVT